MRLLQMTASTGPHSAKESPVIQTPGSQFRLLVLAPNSWHGQWVNRQQLFSRIGLLHPVLYSSGGWFTWDRREPAWKRASWTGGFSRHNNVWVDQPPRILMRAPS